MKFVFLILIGIYFSSCSSISVTRNAHLKFDSLFFAKVESRKNITLEPNESKTGRVVVGLLSAGPIGAVATANTEEDFSQPKAFEYSLSINSNQSKTILSRSIVDIGSCVEVISTDESNIEILRAAASENCKESQNKMIKPSSG